MLKKNYNILLSLNLSHKNITVNDVINEVNNTLKNTATQLVGTVINDIQEEILTHYLGAKWNELTNKNVPWCCPHCLENSHFVRRGRRERKLKTSSGTINFYLYQTTCLDCKKTFSPFPQLLGLKPRIRISTEFEEKLIKLAFNNSYNKICDYSLLLNGVSLSATTARNIVNRTAEKMHIQLLSTQYETILLDGTKVKSRGKERGTDLHLALSPIKKTIKNGREYTEKQLIGLSVSNSTDSIRRQLSSIQCKNIIVDGDSQYKNIAQDTLRGATYKRCLWHIPRNLSHLLYFEHIPVNERKPIIKELVKILKVEDFNEAQSKYLEFMFWFKKVNMMPIYKYLKEAFKGVFINKNTWNKKDEHKTNSLIEREMREINRRADNGCSWTELGIQNLMKLTLIHKYSKNNWDVYFKQNKRPAMEILQATLCTL